MFRTCRLARSPASDVNWYLNNDGAFIFSLFLIIFLHKTNESIGKKHPEEVKDVARKKSYNQVLILERKLWTRSTLHKCFECCHPTDRL